MLWLQHGYTQAGANYSSQFKHHAGNNQVLKLKNTDLVFATFHVDVGETPFFLSIDYDKKVVVISIRGTLSMKVRKQSVAIQIV